MFQRKKTTLFFLLSILLFSGYADVAGETDMEKAVKMNEALAQRWASMEYGLYIHFAMGKFSKDNPNIKADVRQWVSVAKSLGIRYAVLVVKHEDGFCLWDSENYANDIGSLNAKQDVVAEFMAACKQARIKPGIHYSIPDSHNEGGKPKYKGPIDETYFKLILRQTSELHKKYPTIFFHKFDVSQRLSVDQRQQLHQLIGMLNSKCMIHSGGDKWGGGMYRSRYPVPGLSDKVFVPQNGNQSVIKGWMWSKNGEILDATTLYDLYEKCQEQKISFLLNVGPDPSGRIPKEQVAVLQKLKKLIEKGSKTAETGKGDAVQRLKELKKLYEDGLITKEVYETKQKEILDSM